MLDRNHIIKEIKRTAKENGGSPSGQKRFYTETGIRSHEWGRYWARWSAALAEAGFPPNEQSKAYDSDFLMEKLTHLAREVGHFPTDREINLKRRGDGSFPGAKAFRRIAPKETLKAKFLEFCRARPGYDDVIGIYALLLQEESSIANRPIGRELCGYVYLFKSGKYYKLGRSNSVGRRQYEFSIQLPENPRLVHQIKTDDPVGIEQYWHRRFADKRREPSEFFDLTPQDLSAFKKRKFM